MSVKWKKREDTLDTNIWERTMWEYILFVFQIDEAKFYCIVRNLKTGEFITDSKKDNLFFDTLLKAKRYAEIKAEQQKINQLAL